MTRAKEEKIRLPVTLRGSTNGDRNYIVTRELFLCDLFDKI